MKTKREQCCKELVECDLQNKTLIADYILTRHGATFPDEWPSVTTGSVAARENRERMQEDLNPNSPPQPTPATLDEKRDGSWMDKYGACRVCDGEIPHGHTKNCDLYKLEVEITEVKAELEAYKKDLSFRTTRGMEVAHEVAQLTAKNQELMK